MAPAGTAGILAHRTTGYPDGPDCNARCTVLRQRYVRQC